MLKNAQMDQPHSKIQRAYQLKQTSVGWLIFYYSFILNVLIMEIHNENTVETYWHSVKDSKAKFNLISGSIPIYTHLSPFT